MTLNELIEERKSLVYLRSDSSQYHKDKDILVILLEENKESISKMIRSRVTSDQILVQRDKQTELDKISDVYWK